MALSNSSTNEPSFNALAETGQLKAWSSWANGKPAGYFSSALNPSLPAFYSEFGFLVLENGADAHQVEALKAEATQLCLGKRGELPGSLPSQLGDTEDDVLRRFLCIHFPHKASDIMFEALAYKGMIEVLTRIIGPDVKCMQSMLFIKAAGKAGQAWHQDEDYIPTRDRTLTGGWIALDDATVENGCLWVIPGSQKPGVLYEQEWHGDPRFDCAHESQRFPYTNDDAVPVEVKAGSIVFFNGYLLHRSLPNTAKSGYRRSLVNHYMSASSLLPWFGQTAPDGQHIAIADNRDIVIVAGQDPYAHKGIESRNQPHVRASGEGGCGSFKYNEKPSTKPSKPSRKQSS